ncbi:MAG TPA: cobalamin biosynthesis protein, partial [Hyphomicrobiales bacterium]|nr:cobalamin biosynthesis protein [Hyphomicrobiales bacterium]
MFLFDEMIALILLVALIVDAFFGDPQELWERIPHPVVIAGYLIDFLDRNMNRSSNRDEGIKAVAILVAVTGVVGLAIQLLARSHPMGLLLEVAMVTVLLAQRSLYDHVNAVAMAFREGGLEAARDAVSQIVGRDPAKLDEAGI